MGDKEKMLMTSIFSFSHIVFYPIKGRNNHLSYIYFDICKFMLTCWFSKKKYYVC